MHEYSIDVNHTRIIFYLAALSIIISAGITKLVNSLISIIPLTELTISFTAVSMFGIFYALFDNYLWKYKWFRKIGLVKTPDLNGTWEGTLVSSFHNFEKEFPATLDIEQTWSEICIKGRFNDSTSSSYTASIKVRSGGNIEVLYSYRNDKKPERAAAAFSDHKGYATLELDKNEEIFQGQYFNNPSNNNNYGILKLHRKRAS